MRQSAELCGFQCFLREGGPQIARSIPAFCSHREIWTLFPRAPCIWHSCVSSRRLLEEFPSFFYVKVYPDPVIDVAVFMLRQASSLFFALQFQFMTWFHDDFEAG